VKRTPWKERLLQGLLIACACLILLQILAAEPK